MRDRNEELLEYIYEIIDQAKVGFNISDPSKKKNPLIYVNKAFTDMFGYEADEVIGKNCKILQRGDRDQEGLREIKRAIEEKTTTTVVVRNYTKDNHLVYNEVTISPIFDKADGSLKYFLGIQRDVTKETILQMRQEENQAKEIQNAHYNAIGKLAGGLSHEISTPLAIVMGTLEMLKGDINKLESDAKEYMLDDIQTVTNSLNRIKNIAESFREIGDLKQMNMEQVNLYRTLVISLRLLHHRSKYIAKIMLLGELFDLDMDRDKYSYPIYCDAGKLEQVWMVIVANALDQLEHNDTLESKEITINIVERDSSFVVQIEDNGGGVDEKELPSIFNSFASKKEHKGLGIGLSIAKKILDEHGFEIRVSNRDTKALFEVILHRH